MRHPILTTVLSIGLIAISTTCRAQGAPDAERLQAATAVERAMGGQDQIMKSLTAMRPGMVNMLVQTGHMSIGRAAEEWDGAILPGMQAHVGDMEAAKAHILAAHFTVAELTDLKNFYLSPTGQKLIAEQSNIAVESMRSIMPFLQDVMKRSAQMAQPKPGAPAATPSGVAH